MPSLSGFRALLSTAQRKENKRCLALKRRKLLAEQLEARQLLNADPIFQQDFSVDQSLSQLQSGGWQVNGATLSNTTGAEDFRAVSGSLTLTDDSSSEYAHKASRTFAPLTTGRLKVAAGTDGSFPGGSHHHIALRAGNHDIARIELRSNNVGELRAGGVTTAFSDTSWEGQYRDFVIQWTVDDNGENGLVNLSFTASDGSVTRVLQKPFMSSGVPNGVEMKAGWSAAVDTTLQIDSLEVLPGPFLSEIAAADYFDVAAGSSGGEAVTGLIHLELPVLGDAPQFEIVGGSGSGLFTIDTITDTQHQHWGRISVAPGVTLGSHEQSHHVQVRASDGFSSSTTKTLSIDIVEETANEKIRAALVGQTNYRVEEIAPATALLWTSKIGNSGAFTDLSGAHWTESSKRIASLARHYALGSSESPNLQGDAALKEKIYRAVSYWTDNVTGTGGSFINPAWEWPRQIAAVGFYLHDEIHSELASLDPNVSGNARQVYQAIIDGSESAMTHRRNVDEHYWGGNMGYRLHAMLLRSSFINDYNQPTTNATGFQRGFVPTGSFSDIQYLITKSFDGSRDTDLVGHTPDGGFNQHTGGMAQLHMHGYGRDWLSSALGSAEQLLGTPWLLSATEFNQAADWLLDGFQWMTFEGQADYFSQGRGISSMREAAGSDADAWLSGMLNSLLAVADPTQLMRLEELTTLQATLDASQSNDLSGNRAFWNHDFMVHRRDTYYVSTKMNSVRSSGNETGNTQNIQHYHLGDGATLILRTGDEYVNARVGWDWHQIPGTTAESRTDTLPRRNWNYDNEGLNAFAGVASDGVYGVSAFINDRYDATNSKYIYHTTNSHKGTFFFDDAFVALGAGVERVGPGQGQAIRTTLNQVEWRGDVTYDIGSGVQTVSMGNYAAQNLSISSASWFHQDGVGYIVLPASGETVDVRLETRATNNDWNDLSNRIPDGEHQAVDLFQLSIDHGSNPTAGKYQYLVVPDIAASEMAAYSDTLQIEVVGNSTSAQAVRHLKERVTQIAFYQAGSIQIEPGLTVTSDRPALIILTEQRGAMEVTVSDPMHSTSLSEIELQISRQLSGDRASWDSATGLSTVKFTSSNDVMLAGQPGTKRLESPGLVGPFKPISWGFANNQSLADLVGSGWTVNQAVTQNVVGAEDFRVDGGHLVLVDDAGQGDPGKYAHEANYVFGDVEQGRLTLKAGTTGSSSGNGYHQIKLGSQNEALATIRMINDTQGELIAGSESISFSDVSWKDSFRSFSVDWRANATEDGSIVSLSFTAADGTVTRLEDVMVLGSAPEQLQLTAGWSSVKDAGLRIDELELSDHPQLIYQSEFSRARSLADLQVAGWTVDGGTLANVDGIDDFHATNGYLQLTDDASGDDPMPFAHHASYRFGSADTGRLSLRAGTSGTFTGNSYHRIILRSGTEEIGVIQLNNDTQGKLIVGDEVLEFSDTSWKNDFREFVIDWRADANSVGEQGMLVMQFEKSDGTIVRLPDVPYSGGVPDNLALQAGWGRAKDASLRLDRLQLVHSPPIEFRREFTTDRSQAELQAAGWNVNKATQADIDGIDDFQATGGYLQLTDDAGSGDPAPWGHAASYDFGPVDDGTIALSAGTAGTYNGNANYKIGLRRNNSLIGLIEFKNHTQGALTVGSQTESFSDVSWKNGFRDLGMTWQMNSAGTGGQITLTFTASTGIVTELTSVLFEGAAPNNLELSVGWSSPKDASLRLDRLSIVSNDTFS